MQTLHNFISNLSSPFLQKQDNVPELKINVVPSETVKAPIIPDNSDEEPELQELNQRNPTTKYNFIASTVGSLNREESDIEDMLNEEQCIISRSGSLVLLTTLDESKQINVDDAIVQERNKEIKQLKRDLGDLQDMLLELNKMLGIQGEQLEKVESNVETTSVNTEQAVVQLDSAVKEKVENNALIAKIIAGSLATVGVVGTIALVIIFI